MRTAPCGESRLQQQQQQGKRGEQWVPVQEQQQSSNGLFHEARRLFANAVAGRSPAAASSSESLPAAPRWTRSPPLASAGTFFAVDSAVTAALAPADAGAGTGLSAAARSCCSNMETPSVVDGRTCDSGSPIPLKRKPLQAAAAAASAAAAAAGGPASRGERKGKAAGGSPPGESRAVNLIKRSTSSSITRKSKEPPHAAADSAKAAVGGTRKKESFSFSSGSRRPTREGGGSFTATSSHMKMRDPVAGCASSKTVNRAFGRKDSTASSASVDYPRADNGCSSRRPTTGEIAENHLKKQPQQQQQKQLQEKQQQQERQPLQDEQQLQEKQSLQERQQLQEKQQLPERQALADDARGPQDRQQKREESQQQDPGQREQTQQPQKLVRDPKKQPQQEKQKEQRAGSIRQWGDRTEEREILNAFPDLMGAELLRELPSSLQQQTQRQQTQQQQQLSVKQKEHQQRDVADEGVCLFRLWGPHVEKCWVQVRCCGLAAAAGRGEVLPAQRKGGKKPPAEEEEAEELLLFEMLGEANAMWGAVLRGVQQGTPYEFVLQSSWNDCFAAEGYHLHRRDPYARQVDFGSSTCYVVDPLSLRGRFDPPAAVTWNRLIIYELHPGTFVNYEKEGKTVFEKLVEKLDYIKEMHFTAIELLPVQEFGGEWGYNPRLLMAPHGGYGTPLQLRQLVDECHRRGLAVILDVVLNHGSSKLNSLWNWDGYGKDNSGGIYFEGGGDTGWGRKFAFQKQQVRQMVLHAAARFIDEYKVDGLRVDSVHNIPPDVLRELTSLLHKKFPRHVLIAEITPEDPRVCDRGGAGFDSCWIHATYYDAVKITRGEGSAYHMDMLRAMIDIHKGFSKSHQCVNSILGSHDQAGNKQQGFTDGRSGRYAVNLYGGRSNWHSRAQCRMWYSLQATSRGLPMLFMGTETCQDDWWNVDASHSFNWQLVEKSDVFSQQMRSLVAAANELRLKHASLTDDDTSVHFPHVDSHNRVLGFTRGNLLIVLNFSENQWEEASYQINTDWKENGFVQLFNSQAEEFGGWDGSWTAKNNEKLHSSAMGKLPVKLPKWSVTVYEKQG